MTNSKTVLPHNHFQWFYDLSLEEVSLNSFYVSGKANETDKTSVPFSEMAKSTWTMHETNATSENNTAIDSVPILADFNSTLKVRPFRNYNPLGVINNMTGSAVILKKIQLGYGKMKESVPLEQLLSTEKNQTTVVPERAPLEQTIQTLDSRYGVYIPMEKLNRVKRQIRNPVNGTIQRGRILMLMNPKLPVNETIDKTKFQKNVLMLVRQPDRPKVVDSENTLFNISNLVTIENNSSIQDILQAYQFKPLAESVELREALQSQPAIQHVKDLNKIELAFPDVKGEENATSKNSQNSSSGVNEQIKRLLEILIAQTRPNNTSTMGNSQVQIDRLTPSPLSGGILRQQSSSSSSSSSTSSSSNRRQETIRNPIGNHLVNFRHSGQGGLQNSNVLNVRPTSRPGRRAVPGSSRSEATQASGNNLILQIRRQGGTTRPQPSAPVRGARTRDVRPSLTRQAPVNTRRIQPARSTRTRTPTTQRGARPLVRAVSSRNLRRNPAPRQVQRIPTTQRRVASRRIPVRRQLIRRRRPSPPDPFTQRFSAGFQRGSTLLHQPPLNNTSFDGTVGNVGFNPFTGFGQPFSPGPTLTGLGGIPPVFGGGLFLGPTII